MARKIYKGAHSVSMGGQHFIQRLKSSSFSRDAAEILKPRLTEVCASMNAQDVTVKICNSHFHIFFHMSGRYSLGAYIDMFRFTAQSVMKECGMSEELDDEYFLTGAYDLSEEWIKKDLRAIGEEL